MSKTIGSYEIIETLGGSGDVHLARRDERQSLLRLFEPTEGELLARAKREAQICAELGHETILGIEELFEVEGRTAAASQPPPLGARLGDLVGKLAPDAIWVVGYELARALALAHAASDDEGDTFYVCHGHLTPGVVHIGAGGEVRLEGLGLAPLVGSAITAVEIYTAPEERGGGRITPRGDIYSLGAVLYALLSGEEPPVTPHARDLAEQVPPSFREAFALALEPKVANRRITALELEQWLSDLIGDGGRQALADAASGVAPRAPVQRKSGALFDRDVKPTGGRVPPLRSKQATLLGVRDAAGAGAGEPRKKMQSAPPMDWTALQQAAKRPSVPPGLGDIDTAWESGGWDEEKTTSTDRPAEDARRLAAGRRTPAYPFLPSGDEDEATVIAGRPQVPDVTTEDESTTIAERPSAEALAEAAPSSQSDVPTREHARPAALMAAGQMAPAATKPPPLGARPPALPPRASDRGLPTTGSHRGLPAPAGLDHPGHRDDAWVDADDAPEELAAAMVGAAPSTQRMAEPAAAPAKPSDGDPHDELAMTLKVDEPHPPPLPVSSSPTDEAGLNRTLPVDGPRFDPNASARSRDSGPEIEISGRDEAPPDAASRGKVAAVVPPVGGRAGAMAAPAEAPEGPSAESPWSAETAPTSRGAAAPISLLTSVLIMLGTAAVVMAVGIWWARRNATVTAPEPPPVTTRTAAPAKPAAQPPLRRAPALLPTATAGANAAPVSPRAQKDPKALPPNKGYLEVTFTGGGDARVFALSREIGKVGELLEVDCTRAQFIRVGTPKKAWLSAGRPVPIACQAITRQTFVAE